MIIDGDILDQIKYWLTQQHTLTRDTSEAIALLWGALDEINRLRAGAGEDDAPKTTFDAITRDISTLAANMTQHACQSVELWAKRRGLRARFSITDYLADLERLDASLRLPPKQCGSLEISEEDDT